MCKTYEMRIEVSVSFAVGWSSHSLYHFCHPATVTYLSPYEVLPENFCYADGQKIPRYLKIRNFIFNVYKRFLRVISWAS
jgi:hypothetical protein